MSGANEDKDVCQDLRFVAVGGELPSRVTADANVLDGHMDLFGVQRRVNLQACESLSLYIVTATETVRMRAVKAGSISSPGPVGPVRVVTSSRRRVSGVRECDNQ